MFPLRQNFYDSAFETRHGNLNARVDVAKRPTAPSSLTEEPQIWIGKATDIREDSR